MEATKRIETFYIGSLVWNNAYVQWTLVHLCWTTDLWAQLSWFNVLILQITSYIDRIHC